jgi:hypothetical protein
VLFCYSFWLHERRDVKLADFERWRPTLVDDGRESTATTQRIRKLEREHARKEKTLAEAAALLVLKKTVTSFYRLRTMIRPLFCGIFLQTRTLKHRAR